MSGNPRLLDAERLGKRMHVLSHGLLVVARLGLRGIAETAEVGCDYQMGLRELLHQRPPHVTVLRVAVQQYHRRPLPGGEVVQLQSVYVGIARRDRRPRLRIHMCG